MTKSIGLLVWVCWSGVAAGLMPTVGFATPTAAQAVEAQGGANPVATVSVGQREDGGWLAQLELGLVPAELRVTLNGKRANHLFKTGRQGPQQVWLAPDDGLRYGRNVLKVAAVHQNRLYPTQAVIFNVSRKQLLASAGRDQQVTVLTPVRLDGRRSLQRSRISQVEWRIVRAPAGSKATLQGFKTLRPAFTPDVNGTYQIEATVRNQRTGATGSDIMTTTVLPNFPRIGVGIDTMVWGDAGPAILFGTNCTPGIQGCPSQPGPFKQYPYTVNGTLYPVQLLILDRVTLELLNDPDTQVNFKGNGGDFYNIGQIINQHAQQAIKANSPLPLVILTALPGSLPGDPNNLQTNLFNTLNTYLISPVNTPLINQFPSGSNEGGFSVIGVALDSNNHPPGPTGYFNPGQMTFGRAGISGYFQFNSIDATNGNYNYTPGAYASFNTSTSQASSAIPNTIQVNGISYTSAVLGACAGGFHLVILDALTLTSLPNSGGVIPPSQTFLTHCGNSNDRNAIEALAQALNAATAQLDPGLVFLQSIGTPLASDNLTYAASALSLPIEQLGGVADAFNKSMLAQTGYALAGSSALLGDAPKGAQIGVYAPEASGAATGMSAGQPVLLEGLLQRNHLWHYEPVLGSSPGSYNGTNLLAEPGLLPALAYQQPTPWPTGGTPGERNALSWFFNYFQLNDDVACYTPAAPNDFRAAYCDLTPNTRGGSGWSGIAQTLNNYTTVNNQKIPFIPYPGALGCGCTEQEYNHVYFDLADEVRWLVRIQGGINDLQLIYGQYNPINKAPNTPTVDLSGAVTNVLNALTAKSSLPTAGFWTTLGGDALNVVGAFAGAFDEVALAEDFAKVIGIMGGLGNLTGDALTGVDGASGMNQILNTTAGQLPGDIQSKYDAASVQLGIQGSIILGDYAKLKTLGQMTIFENSWSGNQAMQNNLNVSAARFAYGRLLGAVYQAYGLLPGPQNETSPISPNNYECKGVFSDYRPFDTPTGSRGYVWTDFTFTGSVNDGQNYVPTLPIYGNAAGYSGAPYALVLGYPDTSSIDPDKYHALVPQSLMEKIVEGAGIWPVWFFRHNFQQIGWSCAGG